MTQSMEFTLDELVFATGGTLCCHDPSGGTDARCVRVKIDSRQVTSDCVFWALRGESHDGHDFVSQLATVAACCVVERRWLNAQPFPPSVPLIIVDDSLEALGKLAAWNRRRGPLQVVGVTGSFGKTTTREMIHLVLSSQFRSHRSPRNFNNQYGVPLTLLGVTSLTEVAVVELGASARGEIARLCEIAVPDIGVITGIGRAHAEGFGGAEYIAEAKGELAAALPGRGTLFVWGDDACADELAARASCRVIRVGFGPQNDLRAQSVVQNGSRLEVMIEGRMLQVPVTGRHFARSILLAVGVGREFGVTLDDCARALEQFQPVSGRGRIQRIGPWTVVDDAYNASPESTQAAIAVLAGIDTSAQRILVMGDMLELGELAPECHHETGVSAASAGIDHVLAVGRFAGDVVRGAVDAGLDRSRGQAFGESEQLVTHLAKILSPGDAVLVKGSRAMRMERVIDWLRNTAESDASVLPPQNARPS